MLGSDVQILANFPMTWTPARGPESFPWMLPPSANVWTAEPGIDAIRTSSLAAEAARLGIRPPSSPLIVSGPHAAPLESR